MFKILFIRELQGSLYSLRFQISFIIVILVFAVGTISFISSFADVDKNYAQYKSTQQTNLNNRAENVSRAATYQDNYIISPRDNGVVADCKESVLPNEISYNAYNVFGFSIRHNSINPLLKHSESLTWAFIVSMFLSFVTLLFSFDSISGEKEDRTLALVFSNPVPRRTFLFSKLCSIVTTVFSMALTGMILSLIIMALSGKVLLNGGFFLEILCFVLISLLFITVFASFGLLSSAITRHSNVSLLVSLCFWLFAAVVIPNTSVFWANKLFPITTSDKVAQMVNEELEDINRNAPPGSWSSNSGDPFFARHELRANNQTNLMNARKRHYDAYYQQMFQQFENTRRFTLISPIAQFDYINEAILGGGYLRFQKNWNDMHKFQEQFLQWFKDVDAKDEDSPHWYNPYEDYSTSKKAVAVDQIPQYQEQLAPFGQRIEFVAGYLIAMALMIAVFFGLCFWFFVRYDVR
ncbi:ABC transporter permease [Bacteroides sp. OttesenSCG-928-D19]|nr:ABC transporter permease [Bacteroides sp. OttesenSCG-928-D19]